MDGTAALERNREALKRILAGLVAMAGFTGQFAFSLTKGAAPSAAARAGVSEPSRVLPRHLYLAVLRLLRPAEAAARRLIIAAARGLVVPLPPRRERKPKAVDVTPLLRSLGIAVVIAPADLSGTAAAARRAAAVPAARPRGLSLPLFDPLRSPFRVRRRHVPAHAAPRILFPGLIEPFSLPPPPSPDDPMNTARLGRRLAALASALDDLPAQARRFARWRAARDAERAQEKVGRKDPGDKSGSGRSRRIWPLRPGRPPGGRLSRYDPCAFRSRNVREVDEILAHAHSLALEALKRPDTS